MLWHRRDRHDRFLSPSVDHVDPGDENAWLFRERGSLFPSGKAVSRSLFSVSARRGGTMGGFEKFFRRDPVNLLKNAREVIGVGKAGCFRRLFDEWRRPDKVVSRMAHFQTDEKLIRGFCPVAFEQAAQIRRVDVAGGGDVSQRLPFEKTLLDHFTATLIGLMGGGFGVVTGECTIGGSENQQLQQAGADVLRVGAGAAPAPLQFGKNVAEL